MKILSIALLVALSIELPRADETGTFTGGGPYQATGIRIGEVTATSAIVWTRLTAAPKREESTWEVPGAAGMVTVRWWPREKPSEDRETEWLSVNPEADYTCQIGLEGLSPRTDYGLEVRARTPGGGEPTSQLEGGFRTTPAADQPAPVRFTVVTGQGYHRRDAEELGHAIYPLMLALDPDFFVHTGDIVYYDRKEPLAKDIATARAHWHRMYALPYQREFHARVASYFIKDDHDTLKDDCWPGQKNGELTFEDGLKIFREQVPMGESTYRTVRQGRDLQIWMVEGRDFRSSNKDDDGPEKTILGAEQLAWLQRTMRESDATFRVLISATPIVGPDRKSKADNHANAAFAYEGKRLRAFLASLGNAVVICGDRHWQYVTQDPETGLMEFSCGPTTDRHAGGFKESNRSDMHRYLRVAGGFLEVVVECEEGQPRLVSRHHDVAGEVRHEEIVRPSR